jgi:hypothetical protein
MIQWNEQKIKKLMNFYCLIAFLLFFRFKKKMLGF